MDKRLILPQNIGDRRDIFFVREDRQYLRKHASSYHPKIASYIENAKPMPDLVQVLLTALGAYEFWGQNVNGDRFREPALAHDGDTHGHKTFATYANYFTHHVNKDPALAKGKVLHAVWNDKGKRVELIVGINPALDPEGAAAVDRGEDVTFSMGAKVPFDVCSICGNHAKTRAEYCDHLKYLMNQIDPLSNLLVGADNTLPKFFDISRVLIPADKTAHIWTKVASASNPYKMLGSAELADLPPGKLNDVDYLLKKVASQQEISKEKLASSTKRAAMTKRVEVKTSPEFMGSLDKNIPVSKALLQETSPSLSKEEIEGLKKVFPLLKILSTLAALGIEPKLDEAQHLAEGQTKESMAKLSLGPAHVDLGLLQKLAYLIPDRSFSRPVLMNRIMKLATELEEGNPEIVKKAETIRELVTQKPPERIHPAYIAGLVAALYALFGPHSTGLARGIGKLISNHPLVALPLGAGLMAGANVLAAPTKSNVYSVDANTTGLYNRNWQSRFADMQARPVTVIKTGAEQNDTDLARKLFYGIPALYLRPQVTKEASSSSQPYGVSHFVSEHYDLLTEGLLGEHLANRPISQRITDAVETGKRIIKQASIRNLEFLESVPESEQELIWDFAILDAANRITKKVLGG